MAFTPAKPKAFNEAFVSFAALENYEVAAAFVCSFRTRWNVTYESCYKCSNSKSDHHIVPRS